MADSFQEKTEKPTEKRRREARERGQAPRSQDVNSVAALAGGLLGLLWFGRELWDGLAGLSVNVYRNAHALPVTQDSVPGYLASYGGLAVRLSLPIVGLAAVFGLFANLGQVGILFAPKAAEPKWERLSPIKGIQRLFSLHSLVELVKGLVKLAILAAISTAYIRALLPEIAALSDRTPLDIARFVGRHSLILVFLSIIVLALLAFFDFSFQRWNHERQLMMTREEVKEERKQAEGDPMVRARIRSLQRQLSRKRMMTQVPKASVVITNPTHVAVALRYRPEEDEEPIVVAKGMRKMAERIKEIARESGVPIVENQLLARALHEAVEVGQPIPSQLYRAVAEVLAWVYTRGVASRSGAQSGAASAAHSRAGA